MKRSRTWMIAALLTTISLAAHAGSKLTANMVVTVDKTNLRASGQLGSTRASSDKVSIIGCITSVSGTTAYILCEAQDAKSQYLSCWSNVPAYVQVGASLKSDSYISFAADASGSCTALTINTDSAYAPKQ